MGLAGYRGWYEPNIRAGTAFCLCLSSCWQFPCYPGGPGPVISRGEGSRKLLQTPPGRGVILMVSSLLLSWVYSTREIVAAAVIILCRSLSACLCLSVSAYPCLSLTQWLHFPASLGGHVFSAIETETLWTDVELRGSGDYTFILDLTNSGEVNFLEVNKSCMFNTEKL